MKLVATLALTNDATLDFRRICGYDGGHGVLQVAPLPVGVRPGPIGGQDASTRRRSSATAVRSSLIARLTARLSAEVSPTSR